MPPADYRIMLASGLIVAGFVLGIVIGRWWALLPAVAFGLWAGTTEEVEVSGRVIGLGYRGLSGLGVASGVAARRLVGRLARQGTG
jgi:hypothetical protein